MKLKMISMLVMILLVFTVIGQEETETPPAEATPTDGKCTSDVQVCDVSSASGDVEIESGTFKFAGQTIQISGAAKINVEGGEIKSFEGSILPPSSLNVEGATIQGDSIKFKEGKISIGSGKINDVQIENAVEVTVKDNIISGTITGTGKVAGILLSDGTKFSYNTKSEPKTLTIDGAQSHTVVPASIAGMHEFNIIVTGGATVELIDGSGLIYTNGEAMIANGKPFIKGGSLNNLYFSDKEWISICQDYVKCDKTIANVVLSDTAFEASNLKSPIRFGAGNDYIKIDTIDGKEKFFEIGSANWVKIDKGTLPVITINDGSITNGNLLLLVDSEGKLYKGDVISPNSQFARGTTPISLMPVNSQGMPPVGGGTNIAVDSETNTMVSYCPTEGGTTGAATRWITGMAEQQPQPICTTQGTCGKEEFVPVIEEKPGSLSCKKVDATKCEEKFKQSNFKYTKNADGSITCAEELGKCKELLRLTGYSTEETLGPLFCGNVKCDDYFKGYTLKYDCNRGAQSCSVYKESILGVYKGSGNYFVQLEDQARIDTLIKSTETVTIDGAEVTQMQPDKAKELESLLQKRFGSSVRLVPKIEYGSATYTITGILPNEYAVVKLNLEPEEPTSEEINTCTQKMVSCVKYITYDITDMNKLIKNGLISNVQKTKMPIKTVDTNNNIKFADGRDGTYNAKTGIVRKNTGVTIPIENPEQIAARERAVKTAGNSPVQDNPASGPAAAKPKIPDRNKDQELIYVTTVPDALQ
jgi:hypothetical protein